MKNTSKVFKEEINVNGSVKFLTVKEAAVKLELKIDQIRHLISQNLIDHKLEDGKKFVDVNSIDKLVMIALKKGANVYPIRKDYKLKSEKTIDKKIVINSVIDDVKNSKDQYFVSYKQFFNSLRGNYANDNDISNVQLWVHDVIHYYHNYKAPLYYDYKEYTIASLKKKDSEYEKYFYFLPSENFINETDRVNHLIDDILEVNSNYTYEDSKNFFNKKLTEYIYKNHLFYLTLDEFIKEFSPTKYYKQNKIWSLYLDNTEYVEEEAANDEEIKQLYTVNGFERNQPYGSRKNPKYKKIWIDPFQRGGKSKKSDITVDTKIID
jgi:hypothetical protein